MRNIALAVLLVMLFCTAAFAIDPVNEKSYAVLTLTFKNESGVAVTPSQLVWRVDNVDESGTKTEIKADTTIVPASSTYDIELTTVINTMLSQSNSYERRVVHVSFTYGGTKTGRDEFTYRLKNLVGVE